MKRMLKNIQFNKIILVSFIISLMIISGLGILFLNSLNDLSGQMEAEQVVSIQELRSQTVRILGICGVILAMVHIIAAIYLSRYIIYPINKLIKSAEKIAEEDKNRKKNFKNRKRNEPQDLENVLGVMTLELEEN